MAAGSICEPYAAEVCRSAVRACAFKCAIPRASLSPIFYRQFRYFQKAWAARGGDDLSTEAVGARFAARAAFPFSLLWL